MESHGLDEIGKSLMQEIKIGGNLLDYPREILLKARIIPNMEFVDWTFFQYDESIAGG